MHADEAEPAVTVGRGRRVGLVVITRDEYRMSDRGCGHENNIHSNYFTVGCFEHSRVTAIISQNNGYIAQDTVAQRFVV